MTVELFRTRKQLFLRVPTFKVRYYFRLLGANGEIVAQSEAYTTKAAARDTIRSYFPDATVKDLT